MIVAPSLSYFKISQVEVMFQWNITQRYVLCLIRLTFIGDIEGIIYRRWAVSIIRKNEDICVYFSMKNGR
jgi:hypothetical protein